MKAERARRVLDVARTAIDRLRTQRPMGDDWVIAWASAVALLRTVGHALKKVDAAASPSMAKAVEAAWSRWNTDKAAHAIFWRFIEKAGNLILKEFDLAAGQGVRIQPGAGHEVIYHVYLQGFEDRDQVELLDVAVGWWDTELEIIEAAAG